MTTVDYSEVIKEFSWEKLREKFRWNKFFETLLLVCAFSFFDVFSDFKLASSVDEDVCKFNNLTSPCGGLHHFQVRNSTYMFISLPTIMIIVAELQIRLAQMTKRSRCCNEAVAVAISFLFNFFLILFVASVLWLIWTELLDHDHDQHKYIIDNFVFGLAIVSAIPLLGVKCVALFAHGPEMKKLVVRTTSSECQFESALQLWLLVWIFQSNGNYKDPFWLLSAASSILMIGKSGAESSLTFSDEQIRFDEKPLLEKLGLLLKYAPVFVLSALFRIVTLALIWDRDLIFPWMALVLGLPIIALLLSKLVRWRWSLEGLWWGSLEDLKPGHIILGVLAELTTITLWGEKTREASKDFCLAMASFILLLNTVFLTLIYNDPLKGLGSWYQNSTLNETISTEYEPELISAVVDLGLAAFWQWEVIFCLCCGWIAFPLVFVMLRPKTVNKSETTETSMDRRTCLEINAQGDLSLNT